MNTKEKLIKEIEQAPDFLLDEVLDFLLFAKARRTQQFTNREPINQSQKQQPKSKQIWEIFEESANDLPEDVISQLPIDGAAPIDHYLYGKSKQE